MQCQLNPIKPASRKKVIRMSEDDNEQGEGDETVTETQSALARSEVQ